MFKWWIYSEMKIHKYTVIIFFSLFLQIEGENITEWSVQEGKNFTFHLPNVESDRVHISSVEWKQRDRNKMLAIFRLDSANETVIFQQGSRLQFMQNQSIVIRGVKQEDTGNYTCKVIFKDGKIQTHNISLTVYSGNTEQTPTYNTTSTTSVPQALNTLQIVISALGGLLLLGSVIIIILKCRRKCAKGALNCTKDEPIYMNTY
ncbi:uncharacterized protein LOC128318315 [Pangasianodon hypophthalmus]|uniref:uncharacterized protein LOC128318315 n=1 Tax=Pangasianodon hypophthalmus TaxID=310915 RepID=UPI002307CD50|nr:uncharacterized protein LOC128318315 [Pangasianodon hypophthalmus]